MLAKQPQHPFNAEPEEPAATPASVGRTLLDGALGLLLLCVLAAVWLVDHGWSSGPPDAVPIPPPGPEPPPEPPVILSPPDILPPVDPVRRLLVKHRPDSRFGVSTITGNPDDPSDDNKRITFSDDGHTSNTRVWIDGETPLLGASSGRVVTPMGENSDGCIHFEWEYRGVRVRQVLEHVAGELSRRMDTILVRYELENTGTVERTVGLRVMLDSLIGSNDGVPFVVPGRQELVTSPRSFRGDAIPDFIRALEVANLTSPGVMAHLGLRPDRGERPDEVVLTHWPGSDAEWDYNRAREFGRDTAIGIYYSPKRLSPNATRRFSFTYGLGTLSSLRTGNMALSLTAGGPFRSGGKFWVVALVQEPRAGQRVRLELPPGLSLDPDHQAAKPVLTGREYAPVSWLTQIDRTRVGPAQIQATLEPDGVEERYELTIEPRDTRLTLTARGPFRSGKPFWIVALAQDAKPGQKIELDMPSGFRLAGGHEKRQAVPQKEGHSQVNWLVQAPEDASGNAQFGVRLLPERTERWTTVEFLKGSLIE
jgi:hypothetical protein